MPRRKKSNLNADKQTIQRGASTVLNTMEAYSHTRYALVISLERKPTAVLVAATSENPALLKALLRLVKKFKPKGKKA
jgi:hypothetical protein